MKPINELNIRSRRELSKVSHLLEEKCGAACCCEYTCGIEGLTYDFVHDSNAYLGLKEHG
jgi:hypothetical protein